MGKIDIHIHYVHCSLPTARSLLKIFIEGYHFQGMIKVLSVRDLGFDKNTPWLEVLAKIETMLGCRIMTEFEALVASELIAQHLDDFYHDNQNLILAAMHPIEAHDMDRVWGKFVLSYSKTDYGETSCTLEFHRALMPVPPLTDGQHPDGTVGPHTLVACIIEQESQSLP